MRSSVHCVELTVAHPEYYVRKTIRDVGLDVRTGKVYLCAIRIKLIAEAF